MVAPTKWAPISGVFEFYEQDALVSSVCVLTPAPRTLTSDLVTLKSDLMFPSSDKLNASAPLFNDRMAVLDTRASGPVRERLRWMTALNFDDKLHLHGIDIKADASNPPKLKMLLINHRTPVDPDTGSLLDATKVGGNATIEVFEAILGETTMKHIKTYVDPTIDTPNGLAWLPTSDDSFVFTNDHTTRIGFVSIMFLNFLSILELRAFLTC